jgi:type II secretory pathway pseudopilin PulG
MSASRTLSVASFLAVVLVGKLATEPGAEPPRPQDRLQADAAVAPSDENKEGKTKKKGRGKFTISKETTYVTEPLNKDGYPDYARALNQRLRQGVTPKNNANVLIWQALGPHPEGATMPSEFFQWIGIKPPAEKGDYFIDLSRYAKEHFKIEPDEELREMREQLNRCTQRPWKAEQCPNVASWLEANEKPLAVVIEATKRPQYYSPLVPKKAEKGPSYLFSAPSQGVQGCRQLADSLAARALLRPNEKADDEAWQDLLACHRLGRLVGRGGTLIESIIGIAIVGAANKATLAFLEQTKPNAKRIESYLRDLQKLPPFPDLATKIELGERFQFLDCAMMMAREGAREMDAMPLNIPKEARLDATVDLDPAMRAGNRWYDHTAASMREKDRAIRRQKLEQIDTEMRGLKQKDQQEIEQLQAEAEKLKAKDPNALDWAPFMKRFVSARDRIVGDVMLSLQVPSASRMQNAWDRIEQQQDNLILAFALQWYRRDHGRYPDKLEALATKYLKQIPQDLFSGRPLIYRPSEKGYLLYSVGINGKDDGGRGYGDDPPGDDLVVRMPLPELPKD